MDRVFHFVGTAWFFGCTMFALFLDPANMLPALVSMGVIGWYAANYVEFERAAIPEMLVILTLSLLGSYWLTIGMVGAYSLAWIGHFAIEKNSPAAMRYPIWSFMSDFRMWSQMVGGRLWTGDSMKR